MLALLTPTIKTKMMKPSLNRCAIQSGTNGNHAHSARAVATASAAAGATATTTTALLPPRDVDRDLRRSEALAVTRTASGVQALGALMEERSILGASNALLATRARSIIEARAKAMALAIAPVVAVLVDIMDSIAS